MMRTHEPQFCRRAFHRQSAELQDTNNNHIVFVKKSLKKLRIMLESTPMVRSLYSTMKTELENLTT